MRRNVMMGTAPLQLSGSGTGNRSALAAVTVSPWQPED